MRQILFFALCLMTTSLFTGAVYANPEEKTDPATDETSAEPSENTNTDASETETVKTYILPSITIGPTKVSASNRSRIKSNDFLLPDSLKNPLFKKKLKKHVYIAPYPHNPIKGSKHAPITIVEFMDLGCGQACTAIMEKINRLRKRHPDHIKTIHFYMPSSGKKYNDMINFYAKIAQDYNLFWEYRTLLLSQGVTDSDDALTLLLGLNIAEEDIRNSLRKKSTIYYRELDQDAMMAEKLTLQNPPHLFINGIHVGEGGIPLENMEDVILYELIKLKEKQNRS